MFPANTVLPARGGHLSPTQFPQRRSHESQFQVSNQTAPTHAAASSMSGPAQPPAVPTTVSVAPSTTKTSSSMPVHSLPQQNYYVNQKQNYLDNWLLASAAAAANGMFMHLIVLREVYFATPIV